MVSKMLTPLTPYIHLQLTVCTVPQEAVSCVHFLFKMNKSAHIFITMLNYYPPFVPTLPT